jgi:hypothetical protein
MSKSDTPLPKIDTSKARNQLKKPSYHNDRPIHAFDTETTDGSIFALSIAPYEKDAYVECEVDSDGEGELQQLELDTILDRLTKRKFSKGVNMWYHLKFDADVIFEGLPDNCLKELKFENKTEYNDYEISYLPGKSLTIRRNKQKYEHYDIAQILPGGLETVAQDWLANTEGKRNSDLDVEQFTDPQYVRDKLEDIETYAKQDAILTRDTWTAFVEKAEGDLDVPCGKPYSAAYLSADYIRKELTRKAGWADDGMQKRAWQSYAGGRFEVKDRGFVGAVKVPDINSAYPHVMSGLPNPATLTWYERDSDVTLNEVTDADYGFVTATVTTDESRPWQPFAMKNGSDTVCYPAVTEHTVTCVKEIFSHAVETGLVTEYELESASLGYETEVTQYPFEWIQDLYDKRKEWESQGRIRPARILKIILNSAYGKTCQSTMKESLIRETVTNEELDDLEKYETDDVRMTGQYAGTPYITSQVAGKLFNPFLASYITGLTRLELLKQIIAYDLEDETYMLATDSLMIDKEAIENTSFAHDLGCEKDVDVLGEWDYDAESGNAFIVGSGVYDVRQDGECIKTGRRGFIDLGLTDGGLLEAAESVANTSDIEAIEGTNERPITLAEAQHNPQIDLADVGKFITTSKNLRPDFDSGRNWDVSDPTYGEMIEHSHSSEPLILSSE